MKIVIMGTGGVGGYYGALLARAGQDVTFIARGEHLRAIRQNGLRIKSVNGEFTVFPAAATDCPADIGVVDLVIFATKTYQTEDAVRLIRPVIGKDTVIVPLQNGIDSVERIGAIVGMLHMLAATTWIYSAVEAPGIIGHYSKFGRIAIGEIDGSDTPRLQAVYETLRTSGTEIELSHEIQKRIWTKFAFISAISAVGCLTRAAIGEFRDVPETRALLAAAIAEVAAVAGSKGIELDAGIVDTTMAFIDSNPPDMKPSMQRDVEAGRLSELESMVGVIPRFGRLGHLPTPVMDFAYAMLKPAELLAQKAHDKA
jgi:2-dehydropantoate 2-reductase